MKGRLKHIILGCFTIVFLNTYSQQIHISLDKDTMLIGDHLLLNIKVEAQEGALIYLPQFKDTIGNFDIIEIYKPDTALQTISQNILITQFNAGNYVFGQIPALVKQVDASFDTIVSNNLYLVVNTIPVDTTQAFKPIKEVKSLPFPWKEFLKQSTIILIPIILLLGLLIWYLTKKKKLFAKTVKPKSMLDFYDEAVRKLDELDRQKLWQNDQIKEYYLGISEVLRNYLEGRFGVNAMESTTDEIKADLFLEDALKNKVCEILAQADLAKFAKFKPLNDENTRMMKLAKDFVKHTKPKNLETENVQ